MYWRFPPQSGLFIRRWYLFLLFWELVSQRSPLSQNTLGLQEENTATYDESSSLDHNEDEEYFISQKNFFLDPVEEKITLVETYNQTLPTWYYFKTPSLTVWRHLKKG